MQNKNLLLRLNKILKSEFSKISHTYVSFSDAYLIIKYTEVKCKFFLDLDCFYFTISINHQKSNTKINIVKYFTIEEVGLTNDNIEFFFNCALRLMFSKAIAELKDILGSKVAFSGLSAKIEILPLKYTMNN